MPFYLDNPNAQIRHPLQVDIQDLPEMPADLVIAIYGSIAANLALDALHPEKVDPIFQRRFDALLAKADLDLAICPSSQVISSFNEYNALDIFHSIERKLKPEKDITVPTHLPMKPPQYLQFKTHYHDQQVDMTLQRNPLDHFLLMSTHVFFDIKNNRFIFKDEACYNAFLKRHILIPDLATIIAQAKQVSHKNTKDPRFTRLRTVLKNIIKMRYVGWTLAEPCKLIIEQTFNERDFLDKLDAAIKDSPDKFQYISEFRHDLPPSSTLLSLFLTPSSIEIKPYLLYDPSHSRKMMLDNIEWLWSKPLLTDEEKTDISQAYCDAFFNDTNRSREDKLAVSNQLRNEIVVPKRLRKTHSPQSQPPQMQLMIPGQTTKPTFFNYGHTYFVNKKSPIAVAPDMEHIETIVPSRINHEFTEEYGYSLQRFLTYFAAIGIIYKSYQFIADQLELDDQIPKPCALMLFMLSWIICEVFSRCLYQITQKRHKLSLIISESIYIISTLLSDNANAQTIIANLCYLFKMIRLYNPNRKEVQQFIFNAQIKMNKKLSPEILFENIQTIRAFIADQHTTYQGILQSLIILLEITGLSPKALFEHEITAACKEGLINSKTITSDLAASITSDLAASITEDYQKILCFVQADKKPDHHLDQLLSTIAKKIAKLTMLSPEDLPECTQNLSAIRQSLGDIIQKNQEQPGHLYVLLCDPWLYMKEDVSSRKALADNLSTMASNSRQTPKKKM